MWGTETFQGVSTCPALSSKAQQGSWWCDDHHMGVPGPELLSSIQQSGMIWWPWYTRVGICSTRQSGPWEQLGYLSSTCPVSWQGHSHRLDGCSPSSCFSGRTWCHHHTSGYSCYHLPPYLSLVSCLLMASLLDWRRFTTMARTDWRPFWTGSNSSAKWGLMGVHALGEEDNIKRTLYNRRKKKLPPIPKTRNDLANLTTFPDKFTKSLDGSD